MERWQELLAWVAQERRARQWCMQEFLQAYQLDSDSMLDWMYVVGPLVTRVPGFTDALAALGEARQREPVALQPVSWQRQLDEACHARPLLSQLGVCKIYDLGDNDYQIDLGTDWRAYLGTEDALRAELDELLPPGYNYWCM